MTKKPLTIVDAHLDLADNAVLGRPVHLHAREQKPDEGGIPTVGLPDLREGHVDLICATIFCQPKYDNKPGYTTPDEAHSAALEQLNWYDSQQSAGTMRLVRQPNDIPVLIPSPGTPGEGKGGGPSTTSAIILMEGADPIRNSDDARLFFNRGLRIVGLTWKEGTRYAGGNSKPGPLTPAGEDLIKTLDSLGIIHDTSHLSDESFWRLLEITGDAPVMASHSNCRSIVPGIRQLSDDMIRAIAERGGMIGINFFNQFLVPPDEVNKRPANLNDVVTHIRHICDLTGSAAFIGLGTDMDGGIGRNEIPHEIQTSADLPRVADALSSAGFVDEDIIDIMSENWTRFFSRHLGTAHAQSSKPSQD
jgi:membrane dipeptidase